MFTPPNLAEPTAAQPITRYGSAVLHRPCAPVERIEPGLDSLIAAMFASMGAAEGVGLAANQIGVGLRVFVVDCPDEDGRWVMAHVINPVLEPALTTGRTLSIDDEGCLSLPGAYAQVARADRAVVTGVDLRGKAVRIEGTGLLARCLQHEMDHLDGTVYVDRLTGDERRRVLTEIGAH